jgi:alpha-beta hydrolase superfamily lysophospholipase
MLTFYKSDEIVFVSHSLGGYLTLAYIMRHSPFIERIKEVILLSPVGITPKEEDYKS